MYLTNTEANYYSNCNKYHKEKGDLWERLFGMGSGGWALTIRKTVQLFKIGRFILQSYFTCILARHVSLYLLSTSLPTLVFLAAGIWWEDSFIYSFQ